MQSPGQDAYDRISGVLDWLLAKEYLVEGRPNVAYNALKRAVRADPRNHAALAELSETCLRLGRVAEASEFARRAAELSESPAVRRAFYLASFCTQHASRLQRELRPERLEE